MPTLGLGFAPVLALLLGRFELSRIREDYGVGDICFSVTVVLNLMFER